MNVDEKWERVNSHGLRDINITVIPRRCVNAPVASGRPEAARDSLNAQSGRNCVFQSFVGDLNAGLSHGLHASFARQPLGACTFPHCA